MKKTGIPFVRPVYTNELCSSTVPDDVFFFLLSLLSLVFGESNLAGEYYVSVFSHNDLAGETINKASAVGFRGGRRERNRLLLVRLVARQFQLSIQTSGT